MYSDLKIIKNIVGFAQGLSLLLFVFMLTACVSEEDALEGYATPEMLERGDVVQIWVFGGLKYENLTNLATDEEFRFDDGSPLIKSVSLDIGSGSGFIINKQGYIVTNEHVAGGAVSAFVLKEGERRSLVDGFKLNEVELDKVEHVIGKAQKQVKKIDQALLKYIKNGNKVTEKVIQDYYKKIIKATAQLNKPEFRRYIETPEILLNGDPDIEIESIVKSKDKDISIIKLRQEQLQRYDFSNNILASASPEAGRKVISMGYPGIADKITTPKRYEKVAVVTTTTGTISRKDEEAYRSDSREAYSQISHTASISGGNSGGPLYDECGRVVGVNWGKAVDNDAWNLANNVTELLEILGSRNIEYELDSSECLSDRKARDIVDEARDKAFRKYAMIGGGAIALVGVGILIILFSNRGSSNSQSNSRPSYPSGGNKTSESSRPPSLANSSKSNNQQRYANVKVMLDGAGPNGESFNIKLDTKELFEGEIIIGREPKNRAYAVLHDTVSRHHCAIYARDNGLFLRNAEPDPTNGTSVNGHTLSAGETASLELGAQIKLGEVEFKIIRQR